MSKFKNIRKKWGLTISLVLFVFAVLVGAFVLTGIISLVLYSLGFITFGERSEDVHIGGFYSMLILMMFLSTLIGTALTGFFSKKALKPIRKVIEATHKVAGGDFNVQVELKGIGELEELSQSFNKMTRELSSIETLRGDFINNFSHEFKTPIVSVRGFAKLLKDDSLSQETRQEYLDIIISESERLSSLSTNILNLSKYENIEIIADKVDFRLDEQIRRAIVITEPKWSSKKITVNVDMEEVVFNGNEDLTQQIWLNILDNTIKFSHTGGTIDIELSHKNDEICFVVRDDGIGMDEITMAHIFDKFYQGDPSHTKAGNGLGLAITDRIVKLCGGRIEVKSELGKGSAFTIFL